MPAKRNAHRCKGKANSGEPCRAFATDSGLCYFHANPDMPSKLGRIGGRRNRHAAGENAAPLPTLDNALAVRDTVGRLIADVYERKIPPRIAAGLTPLLNLQLRAIEITEAMKIADLERRLAHLEKAATRPPEGSDGH